jgi:hypothetical protein
MPHRVRVVLVFVTLLVGGRALPAAAAAKTDVIELLNGDRVTCEIRKLERGKLTVKTDGMGTMSIEWDDIERVTSPTRYDIELESGQRFFGTLERGDARTVTVVTSSGREHLPLDHIVRITPLGGTFWRRLDGSVDAGFSFTEANVQTQWTFDGNVSYRSRLWLTQVAADSSLTSREDADRQSRNTLSLQTQRFLQARWSLLGLAQFQQNEELSLNLRTVLGGGVGRVLAQSNRTTLTAIGAAAFTTEQYAGADRDRVAEAVAGLNWGWFTFDNRSTNFGFDALSFYALNRNGRVRIELNTSFKSDIVGDLYWSVNLFDSYNSEPPPDRKRNDFGVSAAVGWSF